MRLLTLTVNLKSLIFTFISYLHTATCDRGTVAVELLGKTFKDKKTKQRIKHVSMFMWRFKVLTPSNRTTRGQTSSPESSSFFQHRLNVSLLNHLGLDEPHPPPEYLCFFFLL